MAELVLLIPVLHRPHRVKPLLESIFAATPGKPHVLFITDPLDRKERREVEAACDLLEGVDELVVDGRYPKKINEGVRATTEPLLFYGADDLHFHPGWFEAAKARLKKGIGVVATNDLCNPRVMRGTLATHPLVTREYTKLGLMDDPSQPLCEAYHHEFVDREHSETARHREAFAYAPDSIVEHLHPLVHKAPMDELYEQIPIRMRQGARLYARRRYLWQPVTRRRVDGFSRDR